MPLSVRGGRTATRVLSILVPGGVYHDFENGGDVRSGVGRDLSIPGSVRVNIRLTSCSGRPKIHQKMQAFNYLSKYTDSSFTVQEVVKSGTMKILKCKILLIIVASACLLVPLVASSNCAAARGQGAVDGIICSIRTEFCCPRGRGMQFALLSGDPKTGGQTKNRKVPAG